MDEWIRLARETYRYCFEFLHEVGADPGDELHRAARAVVFARYYSGSDAWERLKSAIDELEDIVGRPENERDLYPSSHWPDAI